MSIENMIIQADASDALKAIPQGTVDLAITDPPYGVRYKDRAGRTVQNDDTLDKVLPVFNHLYKAMKPDSLCISFYGWNRIDAFMEAWKAAGFRPVGHIVWKKGYASRSGLVKACHEQAYVLAKGNPPKPHQPIEDVQDWTYSGNKAHPTEKAVEILTPLVRAFSNPGDLVCDPFSGSGSTSVAAALCGRRYLGIELEEKYCAVAQRRLAGVRQFQAGRAAA